MQTNTIKWTHPQILADLVLGIGVLALCFGAIGWAVYNADSCLDLQRRAENADRCDANPRCASDDYYVNRLYDRFRDEYRSECVEGWHPRRLVIW